MKNMKEEILNEEYIKELEKAVIFLAECYVSAKESVGCREGEPAKASDKYTDLWFHFPMIQGEASFIVSKIAELRTPLGNREANKMSFSEIFERMHRGRKTKSEINKEIKEVVRKSQLRLGEMKEGQQ